jgi:hypothetical protein
MSFLLPAALGVGSLVSSILGSKAKKNQAQDQSKLYNDWLRQYQGTTQNVLGQAAARGYDPYGAQTSTSQGQTTGGSSTSFSNAPVITQQYQPLDELMRSIMTGRLSGGSSLPAGYEANAVRAINQSYEGADQAARNLAARRGLSGEQTYAVASPANRARAGELSNMRANLPLLARELQNQDIGITSGLQSAFGRGETGRSSTSSSSSSYGTQTSPPDIARLISALVPPGPQQTTQTGISPTATGVSSLGGLLGFLMSQQGQQQQQPNATMMNLYNNSPGFMF